MAVKTAWVTRVSVPGVIAAALGGIASQQQHLHLDAKDNSLYSIYLEIHVWLLLTMM